MIGNQTATVLALCNLIDFDLTQGRKFTVFYLTKVVLYIRLPVFPIFNYRICAGRHY